MRACHFFCFMREPAEDSVIRKEGGHAAGGMIGEPNGARGMPSPSFLGGPPLSAPRPSSKSAIASFTAESIFSFAFI